MSDGWPKAPIRKGRPDTRGDPWIDPTDIVQLMLSQVVEDVDGLAAGRREFDLGYDTFEEFAERRLWITDKLARLVPLALNSVQREVMRRKRAAVDAGRPAKFLILKYRRGGISTLEQGLSYQMVVQNHNAKVATLAHTSQGTGRLFEIPLLMKQKDEAAPETPKRGNRYVINFPSLNSSFYCGTAGAAGFGRGSTLQRVHGSEVSRWYERSAHQIEEQEELIAGLTEAASHGEIVMETTPKGEEWFAATYREAKRGMNDWTPIFLAWFIDPANRLDLTDVEREEVLGTYSDEELELVARHGLAPEQIAWRRSKCKGRQARLFPQEYPEDDEACFITSGTSYYDTARLLELLRVVPEMHTQHVPGGYSVEWEKPEEGVSYVIGCDTSEGIAGRDPSGYGVLRRDNGAQVAALHGLFRPELLARKLVDAHKRWNKALLGVERENHGHAVLLKVAELGVRHPRWLYHFKKGREGWSTNAETRPVMLNDLADWLDESDTSRIRDRDLLSECLAFRLQSSGKFEADSGAHDDAVFKWAIAVQMRKQRRRAPTLW